MNSVIFQIDDWFSKNLQFQWIRMKSIQQTHDLHSSRSRVIVMQSYRLRAEKCASLISQSHRLTVEMLDDDDWNAFYSFRIVFSCEWVLRCVRSKIENVLFLISAHNYSCKCDWIYLHDKLGRNAEQRTIAVQFLHSSCHAKHINKEKNYGKTLDWYLCVHSTI